MNTRTLVVSGLQSRNSRGRRVSGLKSRNNGVARASRRRFPALVGLSIALLLALTAVTAWGTVCLPQPYPRSVRPVLRPSPPPPRGCGSTPQAAPPSP